MLNQCKAKGDYQRENEILEVIRTNQSLPPALTSRGDYLIKKQLLPIKYLIEDDMTSLLKWKLGIALESHGLQEDLSTPIPKIV